MVGMCSLHGREFRFEFVVLLSLIERLVPGRPSCVAR